MEKLPKSAEFCLTDVTERISSSHVINFLITEAKGQDMDANSRRGRTSEVCRPRIYISTDSSADLDSLEIKEPLANVEKACVREWFFSLHKFFLFNRPLCESVLVSLTEKINVMSERSKALLESQLGDEILKLITKRLVGEEVVDLSFKQLLSEQVSSRLEKHIAKPIEKVFNRRGVGTNAIIHELKVTEGDLEWEYELQSDGTKAININWKGVPLRWNGREGSMAYSLDSLCVRDTFLCLVNLPSFGEMIARKLAKMTDEEVK